MTTVRHHVVVGFSGGVTSAWCAGWALRTFPKDKVVLLFHDTKEEHPDTYRFLREMSAALKTPITERSDGRSVTELFRDEGFLGNNQNAMCSRILKTEQGDRYFAYLRARKYPITMVYGFSRNEERRVQRAFAKGERDGFKVRFPMIEENISKQDATNWCLYTMGVKPSAMYCWAEHANCVGCVKGGKAYWLAVAKHAPEVFAQRVALEEEFGHGILRGGGRDIGPCECGD